MLFRSENTYYFEHNFEHTTLLFLYINFNFRHTYYKPYETFQNQISYFIFFILPNIICRLTFNLFLNVKKVIYSKNKKKTVFFNIDFSIM